MFGSPADPRRKFQNKWNRDLFRLRCTTASAQNTASTRICWPSIATAGHIASELWITACSSEHHADCSSWGVPRPGSGAQDSPNTGFGSSGRWIVWPGLLWLASRRPRTRHSPAQRRLLLSRRASKPEHQYSSAWVLQRHLPFSPFVPLPAREPTTVSFQPCAGRPRELLSFLSQQPLMGYRWGPAWQTLPHSDKVCWGPAGLLTLVRRGVPSFCTSISGLQCIMFDTRNSRRYLQ